MSFSSLLTHRLALMSPDSAGTDDEYGQPEHDAPIVTLLWGMVQPRSGREALHSADAGAELTDHVIFLLPRQIPAGAWLADADESGVLAGGRRFNIDAVRSFGFGSAAHLEVDCRLVGSTEGPEVGS